MIDRRRVATLASSQLVAGTGVAAGISVGALLAEEIAGTAAWSGLPQTALVLGSALAAVPLARLAGRRGRRIALTTGYAVATLGAALSFAAGATRLLPLLLVGMFITGGGMAAGLQARFAATDGVPDSVRGRVLSLVVWASAVGAVAGPNLLSPGTRLGEALGVTSLAGPWIFAVVTLAIAATGIALLLRDPRPAAPPAPRSIARTLADLWAHPSGRLGLTAMATGHAVMVGIMAMSSVHLHGHGSTLTFVGIVVSAHVAGMYALAPLFGWMTDRLGPWGAVAVGAGLLLVGAGLTAVSGRIDAAGGTHSSAEAYATAGLVLIGLGWSAATIAAATLVAVLSHEGTASPTDVQGVADLTMGIAGASAGALSGVALAAWGYDGLSIAGALLLVPLAWELVRARRLDRAHTHALES
ncbi:MFS transporter [Demequina zhanjiangensis]|uniref:MFS transporter n=1 Tax=Demequina zhanjiangensis TaxID=3051659 RepID=A0ABT8FZH0_9MICO|nr:MFS transporter [Demequina sp. SYSU T00b26]MDN4472285.1 MFS transporter [Demequina sp. SYSU T00b26]